MAWTEDRRKRHSATMTGKKRPDMIGNTWGRLTWGKLHSPEAKKKISEARKAKFAELGYLNSPETRKKLSEANYRRFEKRENHPRWKGGITPLAMLIRKHPLMARWRTAVFERDDYICQHCGQRGCRLNADHIKPFSQIIHDGSIKLLEEAVGCKELWDIANGRTLCLSCHREIGWNLFRENNPRKNLARETA